MLKNTKTSIGHPIDIDDLLVRISFAREKIEPISFIPLETDITRIKKRFRFESKEEDTHNVFLPYYIDLTEVKQDNINRYEIELEVKPEFRTEKVILKMWHPMVKMISYIQDSVFPLSMNKINPVIGRYNTFFNFNKNILFNPISKPVDITFDALLQNPNLYITFKADGERCFLYVDVDGIYIVQPPYDILKFLAIDDKSVFTPDEQKFSIKKEKCPFNSLYDGEYIYNNFTGEYNVLIFDTLFYKGKDVRKENFESRLNYIELNHLLVQTKRILPPSKEDIYKRAFNVLSGIKKNKKYKNDGLIFYQAGDYNQQIYKWKYPELLTIDFKIKYDPIKKSCNVYVKDRYMYIQYNVKANLSGLADEMIYEMSWDFENKLFNPKRIRYDRNEPNNITTANNIRKLLENPITEKDITGNTLRPIRFAQNKIKMKMLTDVANKTIVDIGSGVGGDLHKWFNLNINTYAIEPNKENIIEFKKRLTELRYKVIKPGVYKKDNIVEIIHKQGQDLSLPDQIGAVIDAVTMFNSLTFFFKSELMLDRLLQNINSFLNNGGVFMGIVMDGSRTRKLLEPSNAILSNLWEIHGISNLKNTFGAKISINMAETIVKQQEEYLVDFNTLKNKLFKLGFTLDYETPLVGYPNIPSTQLDLFNLYIKFKFIKKTQINILPIIFTIDVVDNDFRYMATQEKYRNTLFLFIDNTTDHKTTKEGLFTATMRKFNNFSSLKKPKSAGIIIDPDFISLETAKNKIDENIKEIDIQIKKYKYDNVVYPVDPNNVDRLWTQEISIPNTINEYITAAIKSLGIPVKFSSEIHHITIPDKPDFEPVVFSPLTILSQMNLTIDGDKGETCIRNAIEKANEKHISAKTITTNAIRLWDHNSGVFLNKTFINRRDEAILSLEKCSFWHFLDVWPILCDTYKTNIVVIVFKRPMDVEDIFLYRSTQENDDYIVLINISGVYDVLKNSAGKTIMKKKELLFL